MEDVVRDVRRKLFRDAAYFHHQLKTAESKEWAHIRAELDKADHEFMDPSQRLATVCAVLRPRTASVLLDAVHERDDDTRPLIEDGPQMRAELGRILRQLDDAKRGVPAHLPAGAAWFHTFSQGPHPELTASDGSGAPWSLEREWAAPNFHKLIQRTPKNKAVSVDPVSAEMWQLAPDECRDRLHASIIRLPLEPGSTWKRDQPLLQPAPPCLLPTTESALQTATAQGWQSGYAAVSGSSQSTAELRAVIYLGIGTLQSILRYLVGGRPATIAAAHGFGPTRSPSPDFTLH